MSAREGFIIIYYYRLRRMPVFLARLKEAPHVVIPCVPATLLVLSTPLRGGDGVFRCFCTPTPAVLASPPSLSSTSLSSRTSNVSCPHQRSIIAVWGKILVGAVYCIKLVSVLALDNPLVHAPHVFQPTGAPH